MINNINTQIKNTKHLFEILNISNTLNLKDEDLIIALTKIRENLMNKIEKN